jgi:hypothetical protein
MTRYTEYLKEKVLCKYCNCLISKGQREPHLKRKKHLLNVDKYYNGKVNKDSEVEKSSKEI